MTVLDPWVRAATDADSIQIEEHRSLAVTEASAFRGTALRMDGTVLQSLGLVAGLGSTVMGSLIAVEVRPSSWRITHVHVVREGREIGIGDMLLAECLREIGARGATWCEGMALPGDRATKNLFERHGLVAQTIIVGKAVSDPSNEVDASR